MAPDSVIVGTRGRKTWQIGKGAMGSILRENDEAGLLSLALPTLTHVPIIVVRPERKVKKTMEKRRADPRRGLERHFE
ncbi:hypothetical protein D9758_015666 [Tetrapyrgos nigripes]|uniref:UspA domain-containing protein n=1 Tax=Tetrapyrgos nigripes TaxID=182062 RepID=A0A8H5FHE0_9AGAR|nr:hypothetical protein D9758_015666 [Tetrapyrgos nigripes]